MNINVDILMFLFNSEGQWIKDTNGVVMGKGVLETRLVAQGFSKRDLKKLVANSMLKRVITQFQGGWRNTYVLPTKKVDQSLDVEIK